MQALSVVYYYRPDVHVILVTPVDMGVSIMMLTPADEGDVRPGVDDSRAF